MKLLSEESKASTPEFAHRQKPTKHQQKPANTRPESLHLCDVGELFEHEHNHPCTLASSAVTTAPFSRHKRQFCGQNDKLSSETTDLPSISTNRLRNKTPNYSVISGSRSTEGLPKPEPTKGRTGEIRQHRNSKPFSRNLTQPKEGLLSPNEFVVGVRRLPAGRGVVGSHEMQLHGAVGLVGAQGGVQLGVRGNDTSRPEHKLHNPST